MAMSEVARSAHGLGISMKDQTKHQWTKTRRLHSAMRDRRLYASRATRQMALTKKVVGSENGDDRPFAGFVDNGELRTTSLPVQDVLSGITLNGKPQRESVHYEIEAPLLCD
jgi:hypothetical protein